MRCTSQLECLGHHRTLPVKQIPRKIQVWGFTQPAAKVRACFPGKHGRFPVFRTSSEVWRSSPFSGVLARVRRDSDVEWVEQEEDEWSEMEEEEEEVDEEKAQEMDIGRMLGFLQELKLEEGSEPMPWLADAQEKRRVEVLTAEKDRAPRDYFQILDAAQVTTDLALVGRAYDYLQVRGLVSSFGKCKVEASDGERVVTPSMMLETAGLDGENHVCGYILSLYPPYKRRVLVHEAGHVLVAYLLGCPIRGVVLDAMEAMRMGIQGQAGTQFWDEALENELRQDRLTAASIDRYSIVLFAGIAAEAVVFGEAEGGESDENLFKSVISQLRPPWSPAKMSNQARWAVLKAFSLIKQHRNAHTAIIEALERGASLSMLIKTIEEAII